MSLEPSQVQGLDLETQLLKREIAGVRADLPETVDWSMWREEAGLPFMLDMVYRMARINTQQYEAEIWGWSTQVQAAPQQAARLHDEVFVSFVSMLKSVAKREMYLAGPDWELNPGPPRLVQFRKVLDTGRHTYCEHHPSSSDNAKTLPRWLRAKCDSGWEDRQVAVKAVKAAVQAVGMARRWARSFKVRTRRISRNLNLDQQNILNLN
ncbi:hypothetical protein FPV67DRAFT_1457171 [Lyophyllum atratum]|nr:hypothetical protein FPV67DRAFT_1457171 [Lyophyllum atratum]